MVKLAALALAVMLPFVAGAAESGAGDDPAAVAAMRDAQGQAVGEVTFREAPHGLILKADLENLPAGTMAFHIHEIGKCEPDFDAAGGHFNPTDSQHGFLNDKGYHRGDIPNITVGENGTYHEEVFLPNLTLKSGKGHSLLDADGATVMIHQGVDDYRSDPAGDAGARIACGVIEAR